MLKINKLNIFSQTQNKRILVGVLSRDKEGYSFVYNKEYVSQKQAIPLGPEFALWKEIFFSKDLFPSLRDRIPSRQNPAYEDYCKEWHIDSKEKDLMILLSTIGKRGPSTFIIEKLEDENFNAHEVVMFRKQLGLSQHDFEKLFNLSHSTLVRLEQGKSTNETLLTYLKVMQKSPQALMELLKIRGSYLHDNVVEHIKKQKL